MKKIEYSISSNAVEKIETQNNGIQALIERIVQISQWFNLEGNHEEAKEGAIRNYIETRESVKKRFGIDETPYNNVVLEIIGKNYEEIIQNETKI